MVERLKAFFTNYILRDIKWKYIRNFNFIFVNVIEKMIDHCIQSD